MNKPSTKPLVWIVVKHGHGGPEPIKPPGELLPGIDYTVAMYWFDARQQLGASPQYPMVYPFQLMSTPYHGVTADQVKLLEEKHEHTRSNQSVHGKVHKKSAGRRKPPGK